MIRKKFVYELGKLNDKEEIQKSLGKLIHLLKNDIEEQVRKEVITTFSKINFVNEEIIDTLIYVLKNDSSDLVRKWAVMVIGEIGSEASKAVPSLIKSIKNDKSISVQKNAIFALGKIGEDAKKAIPTLRKFQEENSNWWVKPIINNVICEIENSVS
jgi:HEAT repeat protein